MVIARGRRLYPRISSRGGLRVLRIHVDREVYGDEVAAIVASGSIVNRHGNGDRDRRSIGDLNS